MGWWDGSARAGEPFGSTVIAGHVDSATEGIGFFARLLQDQGGRHDHAARGFTPAQVSSDVCEEGGQEGASDRQPSVQADRSTSAGIDHLHW